MTTVVPIPIFTRPPNGRLHCKDWRVHRSGPGRPLDLTKPADQLKGAVRKRLNKLHDRRDRLEREIRRWAELAILLDVRLPTNGTHNGHAA